MERILKVMTLEIKKKGFFKNLLISLLVLNSILFLSLIKGKAASIPVILLILIPYITLVVFSFSLTQEFANKTDKIIFTGIFSRNEIMISKLISFIVVSVVCFIAYESISIICGTFNLSLMLGILQAFILYAFTLGTFILMVSAVTSNFIVTGIVGYVLYFDLILVLLNQALDSSKNEMLKLIIKNIPFYIANTGFYAASYTAQQSIIMLCSGILFFSAACVIINRKSM